MTEDYMISRFDGAVLFLPHKMRERVRRVSRSERMFAEEFRFRMGQSPEIVLPDGERKIDGEKVTREDIDSIVEKATDASFHSVMNQINSGYLTLNGGYRMGLCGSAVVRNGKFEGFSVLSSLSLRISRELKGISDGLMPELLSGGFVSTLIVSPPGGGKTTLLRDVTRNLSNGFEGFRGLRVSLSDERNEIAAMSAGRAQMDVGTRTDILEGCPKAAAIIMLLRAMNPEVIAIDEITAEEDARAMIQADNCGVKLLATAHADDIEDLRKRPVYRLLSENRVFERFVVIKIVGGQRKYTVYGRENIA